MIFKHDIIINMMKNLLMITMPLILVASVIVVASNANVNVFGQQANQTSQQANQTSQQANQTSQQANQTMAKKIQTAKSQSSKSNMNEKLLNFTNQAILAFKEKNRTGVVESLKQIQNALINASGKQLVIVPSDTMTKSKTKE